MKRKNKRCSDPKAPCKEPKDKPQSDKKDQRSIDRKNPRDRRSIDPKKDNKMRIVMEEFKAGKLHSGSKHGPDVTNPKQAIAIGISESKKKRK